jgi:two-component system NarL family sensor kinase
MATKLGARRRADERRARELHILNAIAAALNGAADVQQALSRTLALIAELLGFPTGWVWLLDGDTGQFYGAAAQNLPPYLQEPVRMTGKHCTCMDIFLAGGLAPANIDAIRCSRLRPAVQSDATDQTRGMQYHASIPLYFGDTPLGIVNVGGPEWRELSPEELDLLATIAYQVGLAIERARIAGERAGLARAEERARIAREIHDTLAQDLTAIALHLERDPARARERLQRALSLTRTGLEEARRAVLDLRTAPPGGKPLAEALAALGRSFTSESGIRVHVRAAVEAAIPLRVESELYQIVREALNNIRKHAGAREVTVKLTADAAAIRLSIRDDGRGFDPKEHREGCHGLIGMRERAQRCGGRLRVVSKLGTGTTISVSVPQRTEGAA